MAGITLYSEPKVAASRLPEVQQTNRLSQQDAAAISGADTINTVSKAVNATADAYQQMRDREDDAKVLEQSGALSTAVAKHQAELDQITGADASTITKKNDEFWQKYEDSAMKDLTPSQRIKFKPVIIRAQAASRESAIKTQVKRENEYYDTTLAAGIDSAIQAASLNPADADNVKLNSDLTKMYIGKQLKRNGLQGDAADSFTRDQMTNFHTAIVSGLIEKDPNAAKGYYYSNIKEISVAKRAQIEKALEVGGRAQLAQDAADTVLKQFGPDGESQALEYVRKTYSGEDEKAASIEVQSRYADIRRLSAEDQKKKLSGLALQIEQKGPGILSKLQKTPEYQALDDEHKLALVNAAETRLREIRSDARAEKLASLGGRTRTEIRQAEQEDTYSKLVDMAQTDPAKFADLDLNLYTSKLSSDMRHDLATMQGNFASGGGKALTESQVLSAASDLARAAGIKGKDLYKLRSAVREQAEAEQAATGKPLSRKRVRDITNELLTEGKTPGFLWDSSTLRFKADPEKPFIRNDKSTGARLITDVPDGDRADIEAELRKRGIPVRSETIIDLYNRANQK